MDEQILLGVLAIGAGALLGLVLFVPFVAVSYRRRGGLSFGRFVLWFAALVYFLAIWTYTLLPLPDPDTIRCVGVNLNILGFVDDIQRAIVRPGNTFTDPLILQLVLNVLLFVPLGFFLRVLGGRGILVAFLVGFGISVFIETTQLTGVWGIYPCAYRWFDVDDMLTNTTGAVIGSVLSLIVPARLRGSKVAPDADQPRPVTRGRRLIAVACDLLGYGVVSAVVAVGVSLVLQLGLRVGDESALAISDLAGSIVPLVVWTVLTLATGRTLGDIAVELRYQGGRLPEWLARPLRLLGGIGGLAALGFLGDWAWLQLPFALAAVVLVFTTEGGRGMPGVLSGQGVTDARERSGSTARPAGGSPA